MAQTQLPLTCSVSTVFCFLFSKMPVVSQMQHPRSMPFKQQQKVVTLRDVKKLSWDEIAKRVFNIQKKYEVSARQCREVYAEFNKSLGRREYRYGNCGQTPTKMTSAVKRFIIKKLLQLRPTNGYSTLHKPMEPTPCIPACAANLSPRFSSAYAG